MRKIFGLALLIAVFTPGFAFAEEAVAGGATGFIAIAAAVSIGFAAIAGTLSQSRAISAALEAIGRNPASAQKVFIPMLLGLALIESLVILAFVIANGLLAKV